MRKHTILLIVFALFIFSFVTYANSDTEGEKAHGKPLEVVLQEIRESQGIGENEKIDPDKVSDEQLEELGEAVMNIMHPDPKEHEWMDNMMGGEGSSTLSAMHKIMGYNYLKDSDGGIMGRGAIEPGMMGRGMMNFGYGGLFIWVIFLILIAVIIYLVIQATKAKEFTVSATETPLAILKKRYAKGEITKEEFDIIKKDFE